MLTSQKRFLSPASPAEKMRACIITLQSFCTKEYIHEDYFRSVLGDFVCAVQRAVRDRRLSEDRAVARGVVHTTVLLLDTFVIEGISRKELPGKSSYYRQAGIRLGADRKMFDVSLELKNLTAQYYLSTVARKYYAEKIQKNDNYRIITTASDGFSLAQRGGGRPVFISTPISYEELMHLDKEISVLPLVDPVIVQAEVDPGLSAIYVFGPADGLLTKEERALPDILPRVEYSRQAVWIAFLNKGFPVLHGNEYQDDAESMNAAKAETIKKYLATYLMEFERHFPDLSPERRHLFALNKQTLEMVRTPTTLRKAEEELKNHLRTYFGRRQAAVILCSAGVVANEAAILAVRQILQPKPTAYVVGSLDSWYYEDIPSIRENFHLTESVSAAQVIFVNWDPTRPYASKGGVSSYVADRERAIETIYGAAKKEAASHGSKFFFLVIDKTTNLLPQLPKGNLPSNLIVIETASFTKHQEGRTNYFFGAVFCYGSPEVTSRLNGLISQRGGALSAPAVIHFPRPTDQQIREQLRAIERKRRALRMHLDEAQSEIPKSLRMTLQEWTYFAYLMPPTDELVNVYAHLVEKQHQQKKSLVLFRDFMRQFGGSKFVGDVLSGSKDEIPFANTFNLNHFTVACIEPFERSYSIADGSITVADMLCRFSYGLSLDGLDDNIAILAQIVGVAHQNRIKMLLQLTQ